MTEIRLRMHIVQTLEASTWEFVMLVEGFESREQAQMWMDAHRETLIEETLLRKKT